MTKTNQVFKSVSLPVIIEGGKANYMMNVKFFSVVLFGYVAFLTGVIISFAGESALSSPVWAVVAAIITALPVVMIFATMPNIGTVSRAESKTACPFIGSCKGDNLITVLTSKTDRWLSGRSRGINKFFSSSVVVTFLRAERNCGSAFLEGLTDKNSLAVKALKFFIDLLLLTTQGIGACTATGSLSAPLKALGVC